MFPSNQIYFLILDFIVQSKNGMQKMLTRRDKILIHPWQQRRYEYHRKKVRSALPAIDNQPPISRYHVAIKQKKQQKEAERCDKIEKENLILLQKMSYIMRKNRVDNHWITPQPNFLNRISIYPEIKNREIYVENEVPEDTVNIKNIRKSKCFACTPQKSDSLSIPEARVPWEPEKPPVSRLRSKSVPVRKCPTLPTLIENKVTPVSKDIKSREARDRSKSCKAKITQDKINKHKNDNKSTQSIILSKGSLKLSVNFPTGTVVKLRDSDSKKFILRGHCYCKSYRSTGI